MVVQVIKILPEMDHIETLEFPSDHLWCLDVFIPQSGETREGVNICLDEEVEIPNSRGTANLVLKIDKNVLATITITDIPKVTKNLITASDYESGKYTSVIAFDCRGCEITAWKPTGFYTATTPSGTVFHEVDLQTGEWYDVDSESNLPVSIMSVKSIVEVHRK